MKKLTLSFTLLLATTIFAQVPSYVPTNGLVGWWPFNGNANDESGNGYNLINNSVTFDNDRNNSPNSAAYFSGNNSQLTSQTTFSQFTNLPNQSFSFWFKNISSNWRFIVNYANASTTRISILPNTLGSVKSVAVIGSNGCLNCGDSGGGYDFPSPGLDTGWHHIVVSISAATYSVYYDGNSIGTQPHTGFNCLDATFRLILGNDIVCAPEFYNMLLDDIGIWNRELNYCEIKDLYNSQLGSTNTTSSQTQTALDSYTWPVNNQTYTQSGTYSDTLVNATGCDSIVTLNLTLSYTGINEINCSSLFISPNPTASDFTIVGLELFNNISTLRVSDVNGKLVKELDPTASKFTLGTVKSGVYFLTITAGDKQEVIKINKE